MLCYVVYFVLVFVCLFFFELCDAMFLVCVVVVLLFVFCFVVVCVVCVQCLFVCAVYSV